MNCQTCQAPVTADTRFCPECGQAMPAQRVSKMKAVLGAELDLEAVSRLQQERAALAEAMQAMQQASAGRDMTDAERAEWVRSYARYKRISEELSRHMQYVVARQSHDRRKQDRRSDDRRKQQLAIDFDDRRRSDRRSGDRRSGIDRRDPFGTEETEE